MRDLFADVALPVPLPDPLTYEIPPNLAPLAKVGVRARVRLGKRRMIGVVVAVHENRPEGMNLRPVEEILDIEPVLPADLMELARFTADYYLTPLGEVFRSMLPSDVPPWGDRRIWLTDAGAFSPPRNEGEALVVEALRDGGRMSVAELQGRVGIADLDDVLSSLAERGRIGGEEAHPRSARYVSAVELAPGGLATHMAAAGRSIPGKAVVEYLSAIQRPATTAEVVAAVGCTSSVVRRLISLGVLRQFTQVEKLSLDRHRLASLGESGEIRLRSDQEIALRRLTEVLDRREFAPLLLEGMTGSGKTEVYLRAAEAALARGRSAVLLVPEIALVPALAREAERRFGENLAILHSGLGTGERQQEWERVRRGEARVVLGPRSALFAPVPDLGLLVVDEEQDTAYKQDNAPRYHARDLALVRARDAGAAALLVSATPSLESRLNVERGKLELLRLTERAGQGTLPEGILVDLRQEGASRRPGDIHFSERLRLEITQALADGDQIILLRNRRGYSPILLCRACGEDMRCPDCGLPRTYHRRLRRLICHYCGSTLSAPARCPTCGEEALEPIGAGTERVEEDFKELFPEAAVDVLDRDTARRPGGLAATLERFERGEIQVLIGTQMVSKGHHFPGVALTAVLAADTYLSFPDFRAVERTYNLLTQVAGRAGRGDRPGRVVIQTFHPDHYAIQAALNQDDAAFVKEELRFRRVFHYPPYTRMVQILVRDKDRDRAEKLIKDLAADLAAHPLSRNVRMAGPAPAALERLKGQWRFQLLVRSAAFKDMHRLLREVLPANPSYDLVVDVDPQQLL
ncbi:MAG TPA: primosomal protein N' [Thermoanaerobaculia bacterium]|nr:primosomal protein N' [Thermoanaerobaculia bacterium]